MRKTNWKFVGGMFLLVPITAIICIAYEYLKPHTPRYTIYDISEHKYYIAEISGWNSEKDRDINRYILRKTDNKNFCPTCSNWLQKFRIDEENSVIYMITASISGPESNIKYDFEYDILNYKTDKLERYKSLDEMPDEIRNVFETDDGWKVPTHEDTNWFW